VIEALRRIAPRGYWHLGQVLGATLVRNGLRGVFKILVAGFLAPPALGVLRSVFSFFKMVTSFVDLGLGYALVTFVAAAIRRGDEDERQRVLKTVLVLKLWIAAAVMVLGNLFAAPITRWVFSDPQLTVWVRLAFLAVAGQMLWKYLQAYFAAHQQFGRLSLFLTTVPVMMLVVFLALVLAGEFGLPAAILIYLFAPTAAVLMWWPRIDRRFIGHPSGDRGLIGRILGFSRWVYLSSTVSATRSHLNPVLLKNARLSGSVELGELNAGLYGFGNDLANEITVLSQSLITVLLPKASGKATPRDLRRFVRRSYLHLSWMLPPALLLIAVAEPLLRLLGQVRPGYLDYLPALDVFAVLYVGTLFSVAAIPIQTALYALRMPQVETRIEVGTAVVLVVGSVALIPGYGVMGAAWAVLAQRVLSFVLLIAYGRARLNRACTEAP